MGLDYKGGIIIVIGAIIAHYFDVILNISDPILRQIISLSLVDSILTGIGVVGASIIIYDAARRWKLKHKKADETVERPKRTAFQRINSKMTPDDKLDDLINEIDCFTNLWYRRGVFNKGYKQEITNTTIDANKRRVREHANQISKKVKPLRRLQIARINTILDSLDKTIQNMIDLGYQIEATFRTYEILNQLLKSNPSTISELVSMGDDICERLMDVSSELGKSRSDLP